MSLAYKQVLSLGDPENKDWTVRRIGQTEGFDQLAADWSALLEASASNCLFLTWEWLRTWWKYFSAGRQLFILTVHRGSKIVAIAPFALRVSGSRNLLGLTPVEFLGSGSVGSDYLDLIIERGDEWEATRILANYLTEKKLSLDLSHVKREDCCAALLAKQLADRHWKLAESGIDVCPYIKLSGRSWDEFLAGLGARHRYNFRRRLKNLAREAQVHFEQVSSEPERQEALAVLVALHRMRWSERGGTTAFPTAALVSFHEEFSRLALERGWLRLFLLRMGQTPVAALYGFKYGPSFLFYQSGFDPIYERLSVGLVLMGLAIKSALEEQVREFDMLHGHEEYKFRWADKVRELGRLKLYPPGIRGLFYRSASGFGWVSRRMARCLLPEPIVKGIASRMN